MLCIEQHFCSEKIYKNYRFQIIAIGVIGGRDDALFQLTRNSLFKVPEFYLG